MIEVKDLSFKRSNKDILVNLSTDFREGEVTAIIGPNGAGKTTLLKCMAGFLKPCEGDVTLNGTCLLEIPLKERARKMSYVPQATLPAFPLTVTEMVLHGRRPYVTWGVTKKDNMIVRNLLNKLQIDHLEASYVDEISGGQKQKAVIARALAQETEIVMLDEPIAALDIRYEYEVLQITRELAEKEGRTVIMVLHDLELAARFSDRVILMNHGEIFCQGTPGEVLTQPHLREVYKVDTVIEKGPAGVKITVVDSLKQGGRKNDRAVHYS
jgi:iron complex transport system ATP-binding protein